MIEKIYIKYLIVLIAIFAVTTRAIAQEPAFSQFYSAPLFLNPALAAGDEDLKATLNYRMNSNKNLYNYSLSQFSLIIPIHVNSSLSVDKYGKKGYIGGIGCNVFNEMMGNSFEFKVTGASLATAYFLQASVSQYIAFGAQFGVIQKSVNFDKTTWGSQYVPDMGYNSGIIPSVSLPDEKTMFPIINAGITWFYNIKQFDQVRYNNFRAFSGLAVSNLNAPDESFFDNHTSTIPVLFKLHGGFTIPLNENFELMPNYLIMQQNKDRHINIGTYVAYYLRGDLNQKGNFYQIQLGSWYRFGDSYIVSLGMESKNMVIGISYDMNVSGFKYNNKGVRTLEVSFTYKNSRKSRQPGRNISHPII